MKKIFRTIFTLALCALCFCIGSILGGDGLGIGVGIGLGKGDGNITKEDLEKFVDSTGDKIEEGKEYIENIVATVTPGTDSNSDNNNEDGKTITATPTTAPTPTPHPYTLVSQITIAVGRQGYTFYGEQCENADDLSSKITEAHTLNPSVTFLVDYSLATESMKNEVQQVIDDQIKANGISFDIKYE